MEKYKLPVSQIAKKLRLFTDMSSELFFNIHVSRTSLMQVNFFYQFDLENFKDLQTFEVGRSAMFPFLTTKTK